MYVKPSPGLRLDVVILHEVLHALSHRFSSEATRWRLSRLVEGATDYLTRELAVASLGARRDELHSGYDDDVKFYAALMARLGDEGLGLLGSAYLTDGYAAFERAVNTKLGVSLRSAGHALELRDLRTALQRISARADRVVGPSPRDTSVGGL